MSSFVSLVDKSSEEGEACVLAPGKDELEVVHSWLEVGGQSCPAFLTVLVFKFDPCDRHYFFSSSGSEFVKEGQHCEKGSPAVGLRRATENWVDSGRIGGKGYLWAPEGGSISHSPFPPSHPHLKMLSCPTTTVSKLLPQEYERVASEISNPVDSKAELTLEASS